MLPPGPAPGDLNAAASADPGLQVELWEAAVIVTEKQPALESL